MGKANNSAPFSVLMTGSAQRIAIASALVVMLWVAVAWALSGHAA